VAHASPCIITCSMSRRGNCLDNAAVESWNSTLKSELAGHFESYGEAKEQLFDYIEVFYNRQRRHSSLGYKSPAQYERTVVPMPTLLSAQAVHSCTLLN